MKPAPAPPKRLLTDAESGLYIGSSRSYVRALVSRGLIPRVELPSTDGRNARARKLLIDVRDLDALIDRMKG